MFSGNIIDEEDTPVGKVVTVQYLHTMIEDEIMGRIARQKLVPVGTVASNEIFISSACHVQDVGDTPGTVTQLTIPP